MHQVEFGIAAAPCQHAAILLLRPAFPHAPPDDGREGPKERLAHVPREGEAGVEIALQMVVENPADAAMHAAMGYEEIVVRPCLAPGIIVRVMGVAGRFQRGMAMRRVLVAGQGRVPRSETRPVGEECTGEWSLRWS